MNDIMITVQSACLSSEGRQILIHNILRYNYTVKILGLLHTFSHLTDLSHIGWKWHSYLRRSLAGQTSKMLGLGN